MADQFVLKTIAGVATHTLDDSGNATHTGTVTASTAFATDTISERTAAAGVTIDGVRLKDGAITPVTGGAAFIDVSGSGSGESDVILKDNVADAFTFRESSTAYLTFITTNSAEAVDVLKTLKVDTVAEHTADAGVTVDGCLIKDGYAAGVATANMFASAERTATGSSETIPHGFGATPRLVWFTLTELGAALAGGADIAEGAHNSTNVVVTITSGLKFKAYALK